MAPPPTVVLITGAYRGVGRGLLHIYLMRRNHTVIATVSNNVKQCGAELGALPRAPDTALVVVKLNLAITKDPVLAANELSIKWGIDHIDVLIANAAKAIKWCKVSELLEFDLRLHHDCNIVGFVNLFQAFLSRLQSSQNPKWVTIGSSAGYRRVRAAGFSFVQPPGTHCHRMEFVPANNAAVGPSRVAQHWLTKAIHTEEPWLITFTVDPGFVQTDMGQRAAVAFGMEEPPIPVQESVNRIVRIIDAATRETHGGTIWAATEESPW